MPESTMLQAPDALGKQAVLLLCTTTPASVLQPPGRAAAQRRSDVPAAKTKGHRRCDDRTRSFEARPDARRYDIRTGGAPLLDPYALYSSLLSIGFI